MSDCVYIDTTSNFSKENEFSDYKEVFDFISEKSISPIFGNNIGLNVKDDEGKKILRVDENLHIKRIRGENFYFASKPSLKRELCFELFSNTTLSETKNTFSEWLDSTSTPHSFVFNHNGITTRFSNELKWIEFIDTSQNKQFYFSEIPQINLIDSPNEVITLNYYFVDISRVLQKKTSIPDIFVVVRGENFSSTMFDQIKDKIGFVVESITEIGGYKCYVCKK